MNKYLPSLLAALGLTVVVLAVLRLRASRAGGSMDSTRAESDDFKCRKVSLRPKVNRGICACESWYGNGINPTYEKVCKDAVIAQKDAFASREAFEATLSNDVKTAAEQKKAEAASILATQDALLKEATAPSQSNTGMIAAIVGGAILLIGGILIFKYVK